jgi:HNH endonuclease
LIHQSDTYLGCQVDHIVSEKHGGETEADNLALACVFCNQAKGADIGSIDQDTSQFVRFFNPRLDRWNDHFELRGAVITSRTLIGEATMKILGFNRPERVLERETLIKLGRFPPGRPIPDQPIG